MSDLKLDVVIQGDCIQAMRDLPEGCADLVFLARELLREPYWALKAQHDLQEEPAWPMQYGYAVKRKAK